MIRQAHECPEGMDEGTLIMAGLERERVLQAIDVITTQYGQRQRVHQLAADYDVTNVSRKVVRIIMSYVNYINRTVWYRM